MPHFILFTLLFSAQVFAQTAAPKSEAPKEDFTAVTIEAEDKVQLKADLFLPSFELSKNKRLYAEGMAHSIIVVHGAGGDRTQMREISRRLCKIGFGVLNIDLRGHGESVSKFYDYVKKNAAEEIESLFIFAIRDLYAARKFLQNYKQGGGSFHNSRISLLGYGVGGALAMDFYLRIQDGYYVIAVDPTPADVKAPGPSTVDLLARFMNGYEDSIALFGQKDVLSGLWEQASASAKAEKDVELKRGTLGDGTVGFFGEGKSIKNFKPMIDWLNDKIPLQK